MTELLRGRGDAQRPHDDIIASPMTSNSFVPSIRSCSNDDRKEGSIIVRASIRAAWILRTTIIIDEQQGRIEVTTVSPGNINPSR